MHVIVAGAGIGGLTTALTLLQQGMDVTVVEQAPALRDVGAGIQISANGVAVLRRLGLEQALAAAAVRPESFEFLDLETGEFLVGLPLGELHAERYGNRFYQLHRADLLDALVAAIPSEILRLDSRCIRVEQDESTVQVKLASGDVVSGDALIGADGLHSVVREQIHGTEEPTFDGFLMWRGLIPEERLRSVALERRCYLWVGPGRSVVAYWVRRGELFNFVGTVPATEVHRESWSASGDVADLRRSFRGAEERVEAIIHAIDNAFITGLFYRDPLDRWAVGRVALLGEAAHAMMPFLAQGACQAIEDAWIIGQCLARHDCDGVADALIEYEQRRWPRTTKVQAAARAMVKQLHEPDPLQIQARNGRWRGMARIDPLNETVWGWLYAYNAIRAADEPMERVLGLTPAFEGKRMQRPEAQRAFDLWKSAFKAEDIARGTVGLRDAYERFLRSTFPLSIEARVEEVDIGGTRAVWVEPKQASPGVVLLHFHGGGFVTGSARASVDLAARLAAAVKACALSIEYRLAPEEPFPAALNDGLAAYRALLAQGVSPRRVLVSGESSGGGLAIATVLALKAAHEPLPAGVLVLSPFADLTVSGPSLMEFAGHDPVVDRERLILFAGSYFQKEDPTNPLISPIYGDFAGFPPLFVQAAREEALVGDAIGLVEGVRGASGRVTLNLYDDTVHVFPLFTFLPETAQALARIRRFSRQILGPVLTPTQR